LKNFSTTLARKELLACALRDLSSRRERAFVKLNCAAISLGLLESELPYQKVSLPHGEVSQPTHVVEIAAAMKEFLAANGVSRGRDNGAAR
jgi:transcriptional regulator of aromatic amino acid metabolism